MTFRFLCCSDTHGCSPPVVGNERGALAWLHAGDVSDGPRALADGSDPTRDLLRKDVANWYAQRSVPVFLVRGNHDVDDDLWAFEHAGDLTGRVISVAPKLFVAGVGWHGEKYYELPLESDMRACCESVSRQARRLVMPSDHLILLTHYPPRYPDVRTVEGDRDGAGVWFDCVRELIEELTPVLVVHGHVHRWFKTSHVVRVGDRRVTVVSPGPTGAEVAIDIATREEEIRWLSD